MLAQTQLSDRDEATPIGKPKKVGGIINQSKNVKQVIERTASSESNRSSSSSTIAADQNLFRYQNSQVMEHLQDRYSNLPFALKNSSHGKSIATNTPPSLSAEIGHERVSTAKSDVTKLPLQIVQSPSSDQDDDGTSRNVQIDASDLQMINGFKQFEDKESNQNDPDILYDNMKSRRRIPSWALGVQSSLNPTGKQHASYRDPQNTYSSSPLLDPARSISPSTRSEIGRDYTLTTRLFELQRKEMDDLIQSFLIDNHTEPYYVTRVLTLLNKFDSRYKRQRLLIALDNLLHDVTQIEQELLLTRGIQHMSVSPVRHAFNSDKLKNHSYLRATSPGSAISLQAEDRIKSLTNFDHPMYEKSHAHNPFADSFVHVNDKGQVHVPDDTGKNLKSLGRQYHQDLDGALDRAREALANSTKAQKEMAQEVNAYRGLANRYLDPKLRMALPAMSSLDEMSIPLSSASKTGYKRPIAKAAWEATLPRTIAPEQFDDDDLSLALRYARDRGIDIDALIASTVDDKSALQNANMRKTFKATDEDEKSQLLMEMSKGHGRGQRSNAYVAAKVGSPALDLSDYNDYTSEYIGGLDNQDQAQDLLYSNDESVQAEDWPIQYKSKGKARAQPLNNNENIPVLRQMSNANYNEEIRHKAILEQMAKERQWLLQEREEMQSVLNDLRGDLKAVQKKNMGRQVAHEQDYLDSEELDQLKRKYKYSQRSHVKPETSRKQKGAVSPPWDDGDGEYTSTESEASHRPSSTRSKLAERYLAMAQMAKDSKQKVTSTGHESDADSQAQVLEATVEPVEDVEPPIHSNTDINQSIEDLESSQIPSEKN